MILNDLQYTPDYRSHSESKGATSRTTHRTVSHLSPDTEIKCLQLLVNLIPVTISAKQKIW